MWDEEINKKIKDSADQYHPAYDDTAWEKMEQLLDEHLPVKKDRRRIIYVLPLILLVAGILVFVIGRKEMVSPSAKIAAKNNIEKSPSDKQNSSPGTVTTTANTVKPDAKLTPGNGDNNAAAKEPSTTAFNARRKQVTSKLYTHINSGVANTNTDILNNDRSSSPGKLPDHKQVTAKANPPVLTATENSSEKNNTGNAIDQPVNSSEKVVTATTNTPDKITADNISTNKKDPEKAKDVTAVAKSKEVKSKPAQKKSFIQNFGFGLSIGPDISAVRLSNTGKVTLAYGAQVSYSFTKKFTLRSGFYVSKKIYSVDDDEYHVAPGSTWNNYLQSVNANCKVYEIPLTVSYNFGQSKNHNWFASAGLSSYFMKKESYVYYYKNPMGVTWDSPWSVSNKNKHYFSVLDISGGYQYSFNKRFSLVAEPYVKLPLSGIGAGKIKLNSAGVLFTVALKPF